MALQHFYSRVPARMSLFNRADGLDTFTCSDGLDQEFIETELAKVYENKPTKAEADLIRNGALPPVYCQYAAKDGTLIQSCTSFLPLDYTGERSTYLVHSLVFGTEEQKKVLGEKKGGLFNPACFETDLSKFDLTSFDCRPDDRYPEKTWEPAVQDSPKWLLEAYDHAMLKRMIFALIYAITGKTKCVHISFHEPLGNVSETALKFFNAILQIFPFHLRPYLSFVTYTGDAAKYSGFKVKCITENHPEIPVSKGMTLHFGSKLSFGIRDENIAENGRLVEFFYNLLGNDAVREEFLRYADHAVEVLPDFASATLKNLTDLAFLFRQCSGMFSEKDVLPNDERVYDFVCNYEKHRTALSEEYRANALLCLRRYPAEHAPIPKNVFSKINRIYPTETVASRRTVMKVVLDLIHTDVMREKLFQFIKANYDDEEPATRSVISKDLCRVYYGGFLQPAILAFFEEHFDAEPQDTRDLIVEKLLLTVRTEAVQEQILAFFDAHYGVLTDAQKKRFYRTVLDMIAVGDTLSERMILLADAHLPGEPEALRTTVCEELLHMVESDQKRKEPRLLALLLGHPGFCCEALGQKIFTDWSSRKIFESYAGLLWDSPLTERVEKLTCALSSVTQISEETASRFADLWLTKLEEKPVQDDFFALVQAQQTLEECRTAPAAKKKLVEPLLKKWIEPAVCHAIPNVFTDKERMDGIAFLTEYAANRPALTECPEYTQVLAYEELLKAAKQNDLPALLDASKAFTTKAVCGGVANHLKSDLLDGETLCAPEHDAARLTVLVLCEYFRRHALSFDQPYRSVQEKVSARLSGTPNEAQIWEKEQTMMTLLLTVTDAFFACPHFAAATEALTKEPGDFAQLLNGFQQRNKRGKKWLGEYLQQTASLQEGTRALLESILGKSAGAQGGFFAKLFGKNKLPREQ